MKPHPLIAQLVDERHALDLPRKEAAEIAGIDRATVDALEAGRRIPSLPSLEAYARALGYVVTLVHVGEKHCPACKTTKPIHRFGNNRNNPDGLASYCGTCAAAGQKRRVRHNPDRRTAIEQRQAAFAKGRAKIAADLARQQRSYGALRNQGLSPAEAGKEMGVSATTRRRYEAAYQNEQRKQVAA